MKPWKIDHLGILKSVTPENVEKALDLLNGRQREIVRAVAFAWCVVLFCIFSTIVTIRIAVAL